MEQKLEFSILPQPTDSTCGPTCLHAVYAYYGDSIPLEAVIQEVPMLESGGTLVVQLAVHALSRGYSATIYSYNMQLLDPTWFPLDRSAFCRKLVAQARVKDIPRLQFATEAYLKFIELGGELRHEDLTKHLIRRYLDRAIPLLTGLSATYLHRTPREVEWKIPPEDDVGGDPVGHFVVLCGYSREERAVLVADPLWPNPMADSHIYLTGIDRVICAILLGIMTYDANLLIITPPHLEGRLPMS
ncbi:MAG TPA: hypothetical protein DCZ95_14845 [Verrucomicrobia bacterium]|nr:MAG: hypothetical protein A2X46_18050 [Lentisphaerae bacterium GWF2_57_35]HBA85362.1 hypothetical protein [Verrucomicrobiota bacterium]